MDSPRALSGLIARFGLAGAANTALGFAVIAALDLGLGVEPRIANALGYAAGLALSFQLNRRFVFRAEAPVRTAGPRFVIAAALAFALNQLALAVASRLLGPGELARLGAQAAGVATYTASLFVLCRLWVFEGRDADGA